MWAHVSMCTLFRGLRPIMHIPNLGPKVNCLTHSKMGWISYSVPGLSMETLNRQEHRPQSKSLCEQSEGTDEWRYTVWSLLGGQLSAASSVEDTFPHFLKPFTLPADEKSDHCNGNTDGPRPLWVFLIQLSYALAKNKNIPAFTRTLYWKVGTGEQREIR